MGLFKLNQVLNKAYRLVAIEIADFNLFKNVMRILRDNVVEMDKEKKRRKNICVIQKPIGIFDYELVQALPKDYRVSLPTMEEIENEPDFIQAIGASDETE